MSRARQHTFWKDNYVSNGTNSISKSQEGSPTGDANSDLANIDVLTLDKNSNTLENRNPNAENTNPNTLSIRVR